MACSDQLVFSCMGSLLQLLADFHTVEHLNLFLQNGKAE